MKAIDTYIPIKFNFNSSKAPWMTLQLKKLIRKKEEAKVYNKAKKTKQLLPVTVTDKTEYKSIQGQLHQSIRAEHQNTLLRFLSVLNGNKPLWYYMH